MSQKVVNFKVIKILLISAAILGFIQAVIWSAMSLICILCYFEEITANTSTEYYDIIYRLFLNSKFVLQIENNQRIVNPKEFFIFMWFYLFLSAIWCIASGWVTWAIIHSKGQHSLFLSRLWSGLAVAVSIVDVVLTGLLGHDYSIMDDSIPDETPMKARILLSQGIVLIVAARGIFLWTINVVFAVLIFKYLNEILDHKETENFPIINGYESSRAPWKSYPTHDDLWPRQQANFNFYGNNAPDVHDFYSIPVDTNRQNNNTNIYNNVNSNMPRQKSFSEAIAENANRVATVERNRPKPPPNTLYPEIPEPDYSPIEDRKLKSVLRSTSHYM